MKILLHDYGGYGFVRPLAVELARRGHTVDHVWCGSIVTTPPGDMMHRAGDPDTLSFTRIDLSQPLDKNNYLKRLRQERQYGRLLAEHARKSRPDIMLSGNTPLDAQLQLQGIAKQSGTPFVFWLQDLLGLAATEVLSKKFWLLGRAVGRYYERMEAKLLRQSNSVIAISDRFVPVLQSYGVTADRVFVQENWGDLAEVQPGVRDNTWSATQNLGSRIRFIYAGNLGKKQNPDLLLELARAVVDGGEVIVISQGAVADNLQESAAQHGITNFRVLPFQAAADLPNVLAAADVLVALLDASAGVYCVPSKILTYLAAGRPILASLPRENPAFCIIDQTQSGFSVDADSPIKFTDRARLMARDPKLRCEMGIQGRKTAERRFDIAAITNRFEEILLKSAG